jgi:hypothetical protein
MKQRKNINLFLIPCAIIGVVIFTIFSDEPFALFENIADFVSDIDFKRRKK